LFAAELQCALDAPGGTKDLGLMLADGDLALALAASLLVVPSKEDEKEEEEEEEEEYPDAAATSVAYAAGAAAARALQLFAASLSKKDLAEFEDSAWVSVNKTTVRTLRGHHANGMSSVRAVRCWGNGVCVVMLTYTTELRSRRGRSVNTVQLTRLAESKTRRMGLFQCGERQNSTYPCDINKAQSMSRNAIKAAGVARSYKAGAERRRDLAGKQRKLAKAQVATMFSERSAPFAGGDPEDPRFSTKGWALIKALQNATAEGRLKLREGESLKRQLEAQKRKHQHDAEVMSEDLNAALLNIKREEHLKRQALSRAQQAKGEL
jgi:hypothetical protein